MFDLLRQCFGNERAQTAEYTEDEKFTRYTDEPDLDRLVAELLKTINEASGSPKQLHTTVRNTIQDSHTAADGTIQEFSWWDEKIAKGLLSGLEKLLSSGQELGSTLTELFERVKEEAAKIEELAEDFAKEHPIMTGVVCAVVAVGILYFIWPYALELLGFGELGPIEGSFAAIWQSLYGGRVPYGSLFSYLQRLGMTWK